MNAASTERIFTNLAELIAAKEFYSAHQKTRTAATRLLTSRSGPTSVLFDDKAQDAAYLLWEGARRLMEQGQVGSGVDLALYLVDVWEKRGVDCGEEERTKIIQIIALTGPAGSWRKTFTDAVFSWSAKTGSGPGGDSAIHGYFGDVLCKERNYHLASLHLLLCPTQDAARTLADLMFAWSQLDGEGVTGAGRYAARGCLSYLQYTAILPARTFLSHFISLLITAHPNLLVVRFPYPPPATPLARMSALAPTSTTIDKDDIIFTKLSSINFLQLTLKTVQAGAGENIDKVKEGGSMKEVKGKGRVAWTTMLTRYEKDVQWLKRPEAKEVTQQLSATYFGIKPPRPPANPMASMMANLFGGAGGPPALGR